MPPLLLGLAAYLQVSLTSISAADKPNIALVYADDIGYGDQSWNGATMVKTPNCDRLATGGIQFNDDNGPDKFRGIGEPDATNGHKPNGDHRGTKRTVYKGGTRVSFVVLWPAKVKPGHSNALMSQMARVPQK